MAKAQIGGQSVSQRKKPTEKQILCNNFDCDESRTQKKNQQPFF